MKRVFRLQAPSDRRRADERIGVDVDEELAFHLDMRSAELEREGLPRDEAVAKAEREFGDIAYTKQYCRAIDARREANVRRSEWLSGVWQDARYAGRTLRRSPGFALVAVLTLALGIGANTAIFSVVDSVLLRPLPFPHAERVVRIFPTIDGQRAMFSVPNFVDTRAQSRSFEAIAAAYQTTVNLSAAGCARSDCEPLRLDGMRVTADFWKVVGLAPRAGRWFLPAEDSPDVPKVAVLAQGLWTSRFGADPAVVGRTITLDGAPVTVVGIAPADVRWPPNVDVWLPASFNARQLAETSRGAQYLRVVGRLRADAPLERARAEMAAIGLRLREVDPKNKGYGEEVVPLLDGMTQQIRKPLLVLLGAVGLVTLIACANVANLLLVRATRRETEIAVRAAIGAGRGRITQQLVVESLVLALLGAVAALAVAAGGVRLFVAFAPDRIPRLDEVALDGRVLAFTLGVSLVTGFVFGLVPARLAGTRDLAQALREGGRGVLARRGGRRMRSVLVVIETALAVMLLAGAGLLIRSFERLRRVDPGFRTEHAIAFSLSLPRARYESFEQQRAFAAALAERLQRLPGTSASGVAMGVPFTSLADYSLVFTVDGRPPLPDGQRTSLNVRLATPGYFAAMGIPLLRGRGLEPADRAGRPQVVLINEAAARRYFPNENPIGQRINLGWQRDSLQLGGEIVGVVGTVKQFGLVEDDAPEMYASFDQWPNDEFSGVVRSTAPLADVAAAARAAVRALDSDLPIYGLGSLDEMVGESVAQPRFYTALLALFAFVAVALAAVGIYGVVAYTVLQRTHEIGVRIALGATRGAVVRMVVGEGLVLALAGLASGTLGALWGTKLLAGLLYGVAPGDPLSLVGGGAVLVVVALAACWLPARRAASVDPALAMRAAD